MARRLRLAACALPVILLLAMLPTGPLVTKPAAAQSTSLRLDSSWQPMGRFTSSLAWGDVDGDRDLDLAIGNVSQPNQLYRNEGGTLRLDSGWTPDSRSTTSLAWGDVDGDGDLDLAVGNYDQPNQLHRNEGGALRLDSGWVPARSNTNSLAWGDVDGDGDLDLAIGNLNQPNQLYRNEGGILRLDTSWAPMGQPTWSVAWGDVDGDGDLDLAIGNYNQPNQLYRSEGGTLNLDSSWVPESRGTVSLAWGDVDGDGDLDLAVGNQRRNDRFSFQPNQLYRNEGGTLRLDSSWAPSGRLTSSLAWGDMDGDGDLDLAVGNDNQPNQLYRNEGGTLRLDSSWAPDGSITTSLAWGDVDGDGDLDLAVGYSAVRSNQLYRNEGGTLHLDNRWSATSLYTRSVVWGDVDGDGDLDLAVGNDGAPNQLYRNEGGTLRLDGGWTPTGRRTFSLAWGDVDGDGDLDLAVGNYNQANQLYRNEGGALRLDSSWAPESRSTTSLAWGDVDGDGDLDLAVGNDSLSNELYRNEGGTLRLDTGWTPAGSNTWCLAWGDVDGDGDLDLAVGNDLRLDGSGRPNQLYRNEGGTLRLNTEWTPEVGYTRSLAWGDVDSDGDLDLAVGNDSQANQLYRNEGGILRLDSSWTPTGGRTSSLAWGDMDSDGDLDLAVGNDSLPNQLQLYRNEDGALRLDGGWTPTDGRSISLAWGDVDGDGDLDLAIGNFGQPNQLFLPSRSRRQLPNNPTTAAVTSPAAATPGGTAGAGFLAAARIISNTGVLNLPYSLTDPEADPVKVRAEYSLDGGGHWLPALAATGSPTRSLSTGLSVGTPVTNTVSGSPFSLPLTVEVPERTSAITLTDLLVTVTISHTNLGQLGLTLRRPDSSPVVLAQQGDLSGSGVARITFRDRSATAVISGTFPYSATTYQPRTLFGELRGQAAAGAWSLDVAGGSGAMIGWALQASAAHTFAWDTIASGVYGQTDTAVVRLILATQGEGPYLYTERTSTSTLFRLRGTIARSVRVDERGSLIGAPGALVYRLPPGATRGAGPLLHRFTRQPLLSPPEGYVASRDPLTPGDRLVAVWPVTRTGRLTYAYTSAASTPAGLELATVGPEGGTQTLVVTPTNPLLLLNLSVGLEWDARADTTYVAELKSRLGRASEILYDWTNGQVALGDLSILHGRQSWEHQLDQQGNVITRGVDIRVYASNEVRPNATQGGISDRVFTETYTLAPGGQRSVTYEPGYIRIGASWNSDGDPDRDVAEDWARALAHELGHFALFLDETYLGREGELLVPVEGCASPMGDPYVDSNSEFRPAGDWPAACRRTLQHLSTGLAEWEQISRFYTRSSATDGFDFRFNLPASAASLPGPAALPMAVTTFREQGPTGATGPASATYGVLPPGGGRYQPQPGARAINFPAGNGPPLDLGAPGVGVVQTRALGPADTLCVFDPEARLAGCGLAPTGLQLSQIPADWRPVVQLTPLTSAENDTMTLQVTVPAATVGALAPSQSLRLLFYPREGDTTPVPATLALTGSDYRADLQLGQVVEDGLVRLWVEEPAPRREAVADYAVGGSPAKKTRPPRRTRRNAPAVSPDGQATLFAEEINFTPGQFFTLQRVASLPELPPWATVVGQGYRLLASSPDLLRQTLALSLSYPEGDVPPGLERDVRMLFHDGQTWRELTTRLDRARNEGVVKVEPAAGIYVLVTSVRLRFDAQGWNLIYAYPGAAAQLPLALAGAGDSYSMVYGYNGADADDPWKLYAPRVPAPWAGVVNDLDGLENGASYWVWLDSTGAVTVPVSPELGPEATLAQAGGLLRAPPATYYGVAPAGAGAASLTVEARVGESEVLCGAAASEPVVVDGVTRQGFSVNVRAIGPGADQGCGVDGATVQLVFLAGEAEVGSVEAVWDNTRLHMIGLQTRYAVYLPYAAVAEAPEAEP